MQREPATSTSRPGSPSGPRPGCPDQETSRQGCGRPAGALASAALQGWTPSGGQDRRRWADVSFTERGRASRKGLLRTGDPGACASLCSTFRKLSSRGRAPDPPSGIGPWEPRPPIESLLGVTWGLGLCAGRPSRPT